MGHYRVMGKIAQDMDTFRMPVDLKIETEGNPEQQKVEVMGTSSEFTVDTFGKPKKIVIDPDNKLLRYDSDIRVAVAIRRGEQFFQLADFTGALREYEKALETNRTSSLANFRIAEVYFNQGTFQEAANKFRAVLDGDLTPKWTEVWARINLGKIYDVSGQRDRAVDQYNQALRTKDDTAGAQEEATKYLKDSLPARAPRRRSIDHAGVERRWDGPAAVLRFGRERIALRANFSAASGVLFQVISRLPLPSIVLWEYWKPRLARTGGFQWPKLLKNKLVEVFRRTPSSPFSHLDARFVLVSLPENL